MSTRNKAILRPKVRFSESSDNMPNEENAQHFEEKAVLGVNGPRIKSIEILKKPVRIIYSKQQAYNKDTPVSKTEISTHLSDAASENIHDISPSNKNLTNVPKILCNSNDTKQIGKNYKGLLLGKSSQDNGSKVYRKDLQQMGKENKDTILKKTVPNKNESKKRTKNIQTVVQKSNTVNVKSSKMTQSISKIMRKENQTTKTGVLNVKAGMYNVMPCYKRTTKKSSVKKTVLHNVSDLKIKTSVEPGVSHKRQDNINADNANERCIVTKGADVGKLAQPEYNSIMCTINKLRELEQQRIVIDIDHLPSAQKSLVTGKISTALDFPLDEAIYKNLVDLSIDEKQLPSTITRSKDPEPRQKDVTPKLPDFFTPEDTKEICEAVQVKPRIPKSDENMDFLKICDKILKIWKSDFDNIE